MGGVRGALLVLVMLGVVGSAAACRGDSGSSGDADAGPTPDAASEKGPRDLETIDDPYSLGIGPVCRQEAVLAGASPFPEDPDEIAAYMVYEPMTFPDTPEDLRGVYFSVGLLQDWAVSPEQRGWEGVNALICLEVVPGSERVRLECEGPVVGGEATWTYWTARLQVVVIDPATAEVVAKDEPFDSETLLPTLRCATPPHGLGAGERGNIEDFPPVSWIAETHVAPFVAELQREGGQRRP